MERYKIKNFKLGSSSKLIEFELKNILGFPTETDFDGGYSVEGVVSIHIEKYSVDNENRIISKYGFEIVSLHLLQGCISLPLVK